MTKNTMARYITKALYNMNHLPKEDHHHVKRLQKQKKNDLQYHYEKAMKIIRGI